MSRTAVREDAPAVDRVALPVRYPDVASRPTMDRRAWWLVVMNILIPGSAQVLAGNRRLGRIGLAATLIAWSLAAVVLIVAVASPTTLVTIVTNPIVLVLIQVLIVGYVVLWIVLTLDTLRLVRLVRLGTGARVGAGFVTAAVLAVAGGGGAYAFMVAGSTKQTLGEVFQGAVAAPPIDGYYNILLIGADSGEDRDGLRPDSTSVVSIDAETGETISYGIPRDLWGAPFPEDSPMHALFPNGFGVDGCESSVCQFNSIYTEVDAFLDGAALYPEETANGEDPGILAMRDAASGVLGIPVQYYVLVDMQGFQALIDALGGITVNVQEALPVNGAWEDGEMTFEPDYWIQPGVQVLDGYNALWYARSRYTTSDYDRMLRQREVQEAILRQFDPATVLTNFQQIAGAGAATVTTSIPQSMVSTFLELAMKMRDNPDIVDIELTPPTVDPEQPDYAYIHELVASTRTVPETDAVEE